MPVATTLIIKRVHDYDEKGWYALLMLIPIINLYVMFNPGNPSPNRFGNQPDQPTSLLKALAILSVLISFFLVVFYLNQGSS